MKTTPSIRGRPLVAFVLVMVGWTTMRVLTWHAEAFSPVTGSEPALLYATVGMAGPDEVQSPAASIPVASIGTKPEAAGVGSALRALGDVRHVAAHASQAGVSSPVAGIAAVEPVHDRKQVPTSVTDSPPVKDSTSASMPFSPAWREPLRQRGVSADSWLLLRRGGKGSLGSGMAPATYGASQAGAILRYRLAQHNGYRPTAYLRATAALNGSDEKEAALGLSARAIAALPVVAAAELRVTDQPAGTRLRPAVFAVTELPPFDLPLGMRGEAYAQVGYVGGRDSTAFADGQLRIDRLVARSGRAGLRIGAGSWGGVQKGCDRLDIGPTAAITMGLGKSTSLRLAIDWRFRVAGNATPDSGPAMTLSAGF